MDWAFLVLLVPRLSPLPSLHPFCITSYSLTGSQGFSKLLFLNSMHNLQNSYLPFELLSHSSEHNLLSWAFWRICFREITSYTWCYLEQHIIINSLYDANFHSVCELVREALRHEADWHSHSYSTGSSASPCPRKTREPSRLRHFCWDSQQAHILQKSHTCFTLG